MRRQPSSNKCVYLKHLCLVSRLFPVWTWRAWLFNESILSGTYIFPTQCCFAIFTVDVSHSMKTCQQHSLLCWSTTNIYPECMREKEGKSKTEKYEAQMKLILPQLTDHVNHLITFQKCSNCIELQKLLIDTYTELKRYALPWLPWKDCKIKKKKKTDSVAWENFVLLK